MPATAAACQQQLLQQQQEHVATEGACRKQQEHASNRESMLATCMSRSAPPASTATPTADASGRNSPVVCKVGKGQRLQRRVAQERSVRDAHLRARQVHTQYEVDVCVLERHSRSHS
eukprot:26100-Chlamydomonas_euryale.AAC.1